MTYGVWGQGINTPAAITDWEEINFDFNSSVLVDGFPSLLRLAELLKQNDSYKVRVEGYTDSLGTSEYNLSLGLNRANAVRDFLLKYGARNNQITTASLGKTAPKVPAQGAVFRRTDEARYMNRRVVLTVQDGEGRTVGAGGAGDAIRAINAQNGAGANGAQGPQGPQGPVGPGGPAGANGANGNICNCADILKRLDQLDDIAKALKDLADQNAALKKDLDDLRAQQNQNQNQTSPALQQAQQALQQAQQTLANAPKPPSADDVAAAVQQRLATQQTKALQLLGMNVGSDAERNVTFSGRARYFKPFGDSFGVQAQAEYYYLRGQREGQFDIGLVDRFSKRLQMGLFTSFKNVSLTGNQNTGTLGQGSFVLDYIFSRGKVGIFASKGFKTQALVNRANGVNPNGTLQNNVIVERYLSVVDQVGVGATVGLMKNVYAEGNIAYLRSVASSNRAGGSLRLVFPMNDKFAFTVEGGVNETLLPVMGTQQGRAAVGFQLGNFLRPKNLLTETHAIPMEIPRVRYETLTKIVRTEGNDPPVADAGPSLSNVAEGTVTLDGSASFDPDGDPITYQWVQEAGPGVSLSNPTAAKPTFTAAANQSYSFRLTVRDDHGGQGIARVTISTRTSDRAQVLFFLADPRQIIAGQQSTLSWRTTGATSVTISGVGTVAAQGSVTVSPTSTTTYTITASNGTTQETAQVTVALLGAKFQACFATPANIVAGSSTVLNWTTAGATGVSISPGIGAVAPTGSVSVSPTANTTYTLTTTGGGATDTCTVGVTVQPGNPGTPNAAPVVSFFSASPATIPAGGSTSLNWSVNGATSVSISNIGNVGTAGTTGVSPAATTTYVLTATNAIGTTTAQATVTVNPAAGVPIVAFFAASPATISTGGSSALNWSVTGATSVSISSVGTVAAAGTTSVSPAATTTYILTATNSAGSVTSQTTVTVTTGGNPPGPGVPIIAQFSASPATIDQGQSSTLNWSVTGATSVSISNVGAVAASGSTSVSPTSTITYILTATNANGSATAQATVNVNQIAGPVILQFDALPQELKAGGGQSSRLLCSTVGAQSITINGTTFTTSNTAVLAVSPSVTTTYTCTATNLAGQTATRYATVFVIP